MKARTLSCRRVGYIDAASRVGTQFHPEATPAIVRRWAALAAEALPPGITAEKLARQSDEMDGEAIRAQAFRRFDAWWALRAG